VVVVVEVLESAEETRGVPTASVAMMAIAATERAAKPFMSRPFNGVLKSVLTQSLRIL
jgi:hypothetical protein